MSLWGCVGCRCVPNDMSPALNGPEEEGRKSRANKDVGQRGEHQWGSPRWTAGLEAATG